jgi:hypothetical protein
MTFLSYTYLMITDEQSAEHVLSTFTRLCIEQRSIAHLHIAIVIESNAVIDAVMTATTTTAHIDDLFDGSPIFRRSIRNRQRPMGATAVPNHINISPMIAERTLCFCDTVSPR